MKVPGKGDPGASSGATPLIFRPDVAGRCGTVLAGQPFPGGFTSRTIH
jgi:hypothetical protein